MPYRASLNNGVRHTCLTDMDVEMVIGFGEYLVSALEKTEKLLSNIN